MTYGSTSLGSATYGGFIGTVITIGVNSITINLEGVNPNVENLMSVDVSAGNINVEGINPKAGIQTFYLYKPHKYTTDSEWKHIAFKMNGAGYKSQINSIKVETEPLKENARCDFKLNYNKGQSVKTLESIQYNAGNPTKTKHTILSKGPQVEDFRIDISHENGSEDNPVKIRSIEIKGYQIQDN